MSEPSTLRLKRKATEDAPSILVLESQVKRTTTKKLHYVRKASENGGINTAAQAQPEDVVVPLSEQQTALDRAVEPVKREFQLSRKRRSDDGQEGVATFVEKKPKDQQHEHSSFEGLLPSESSSPQKQLRKPSARAITNNSNKLVQHAETEAERQRMEEMSEYMQDEFVEEVKRALRVTDTAAYAPSSKPVKPPKISGQRSKEIHQQRAAAHQSSAVASRHDIPMEDESDYVYDTYILAPADDLDAAKIEAQTGLASVGYLVIDKEDESLWQTYLEDDPSDDDGGEDSDDDDENAEDFYGADYPEDELASDDEFDRNNYAYRGRGAFDEEYDEDTGAYSDDDEFERAMNPFGRNGIPKRFASWK